MEGNTALIARLKGKKEGGRLDGWFTETLKCPDGETVKFAYGYIHDDPRWVDGQHIKTSVVLEVHEEISVVETKNTYYSLGEPATEDQKYHLKSFWY